MVSCQFSTLSEWQRSRDQTVLESWQLHPQVFVHPGEASALQPGGGHEWQQAGSSDVGWIYVKHVKRIKRNKSYKIIATNWQLMFASACWMELLISLFRRSLFGGIWITCCFWRSLPPSKNSRVCVRTNRLMPSTVCLGLVSLALL